MTRLRVDVARLEAFVGELRRVAAQLERVHREVDARAEQVDWTGRAATARAAAQARWSTGAEEVHAALEELKSIAATAHGNYAAAVHANRRMWSL